MGLCYRVSDSPGIFRARIVVRLESIPKKYESEFQLIGCMDYLNYWSLREPLFAAGAARSFFWGAPQRKVISWISDLVDRGSQLGVLVCPAGVGTTTLLQHLASLQGIGNQAVEAIYTTGQKSSVDRTFAALSTGFGFSTNRHQQRAVMHAMQANAAADVRTLWLVDAVGKHSIQAIQQATEYSPKVTVIATITPSLFRLARKQFGRKTPNTEVAGLCVEDTQRFLAHGLWHAGCNRKIFSDHAVEALQAQAKGRVRELVGLSIKALQVGYEQQASQVSTRQIESAVQSRAA